MKIINLYLESKRLDEANLRRLFSKSINETPKMAKRGEQLSNSVRYFGLSKDGTLNFKVKSQTFAGRYYYVYIESPDILKLADTVEEGGRFSEADLNKLLTMNGFRIHCGCPAYLYWAFQYMATQGDYEIQPETRAPKRNNTLLQGSICKHLSAVIKNLYENAKIRQALIHDIDNYLRMIVGLDYEDYQQLNHAKQIQQQNRAVKWKNKPSDFMNDYFARQAKHHPFLDDHDIKHSLKMEINKFIRTNPQGSVDDFLRSYFQMTQKAFAEDMQIPENAVEDYFNELGWDKKQDKAIQKQTQVSNPPENSGLNAGILTNDSEQLHEAEEEKEYYTLDGAHRAYLDYLKGHIANVNAALDLILSTQASTNPFLEDNRGRLQKICKAHDMSKYLEDEFIPYLHHFYPTCKEDEMKSEEFEQACRHHVTTNPHHWDYWLDQNTLELIDNINEEVYKLYCVERCCDWLAMARQHDEEPREWYNANKDSFKMPDYGIELIDDIMSKIPDDYYLNLPYGGTRGELDE